MMLCAKNYCNLLIFGRVIVKMKRGGRFFQTQAYYAQDSTQSNKQYSLQNTLVQYIKRLKTAMYILRRDRQ